MTPSLCSQWTQISIKNITLIGPQSAPDVTDVSRDGGHSVLINDKILWLYDDTECMGYDGKQLSFVSNTASYADPNKNISIVHDFGVVMVGKDVYGREQYAILADTTVGDGGWVPFQPDELQFNKERKGKERVAICWWRYTSTRTLANARYNRARYSSNAYQYYSSVHLFTSRIRRLQASGSIEGVPRSWDDIGDHYCT